MAKAKNKVIAGDYEGWSVDYGWSGVFIQGGFMAGYEKVELSKGTVESYELLDETKRKNATSAVTRGLLGAFILGPVGALAAVSAKTKGIYVIAIEFKDGKRSLLEVNEKVYKQIITKCF